MSFIQQRVYQSMHMILAFIKENEPVTFDAIAEHMPMLDNTNLKSLLLEMQKEHIIYYTEDKGIREYYINELPF